MVTTDGQGVFPMDNSVAGLKYKSGFSRLSLRLTIICSIGIRRNIFAGRLWVMISAPGAAVLKYSSLSLAVSRIHLSLSNRFAN